jgi:hypothetical protein
VKINENAPQTFVEPKPAKGDEKNKPVVHFSSTLAKAAGQSNQSTQQTAKVQAMQPMTHVSPVGNIIEAGKTQAVEKQVGQTINILDRYAEALGDPARGLKQIKPLADELETEGRRLNQLSRALPDGHALKELAGETSVKAVVEALKFNRGDWV